MMWLGVDGGGTKTAFSVFDDEMRELSSFTLGTCHFGQVGFDGLYDVIAEGMAHAQEAAGLTGEFGVALGIGGYGEDTDADRAMRSAVSRAAGEHPVLIVNDVRSAHAGAFGASDGIVLIAGTGSIAYGRRGAAERRCGGWDYQVGDEGSAYWMGKELVRAFSRQADGRSERGPLYHVVRDALDLVDDFGLITYMRDRVANDRRKTAQLSKLVTVAAAAGDRDALDIFNRAAEEDALMVKTIVRELFGDCLDKRGSVPVACIGGTFNAGSFILEPLAHALPGCCRLVQASNGPAMGACLLLKNKLGGGSMMDLDPQVAEAIVTNLKDIVHYEINLFDTTGTIIASTDRARVGMSHQGARLAIARQQSVIVADDDQFEGARRGINLPIMFNDSVVAAVGINGPVDKVEPLGNVIRKMTEILIREGWEQITRFDQRSRISKLASLLTLPKRDEGLLNYLATVLSVDLNRTRRVVLGRLMRQNEDPSNDVDEDPYAIVYGYMRQFPNSFFSSRYRTILLFIDKRDDCGLQGALRGMQRDIDTQLHAEVAFGIGDLENGYDTYWRSYREAQKATDWLLFTRQGSLAYYSDLDYGIFLSAIPREEATLFVKHIFRDLPNDQVNKFEETFDAYSRNNGSLAHAAGELFIHKNTLQKRLNKVAEKTGLNPRVLDDYAVLSIAFKLRRFLAFESRTREEGSD